MDKIALIDGDSIAYIAGAQEELQHVFKTVDTYLARILEACETRYYELYVEAWNWNKTNFRTKLAKTKEYKGARKGRPAPTYLSQAKQYLVSRWNAKVVDGEESEDRVIIRYHEITDKECIIAGIDKDLKQVPCTFYNYNKDEFEQISNIDACYNFAVQAITGDNADSIPGMPGRGQVAACRLLEPFRESLEDLDVSSCGFMQMWEHTLNYIAYLYANEGLSYAYLEEQLGLLYLRRHNDEMLTLPMDVTEFYSIGGHRGVS